MEGGYMVLTLPVTLRTGGMNTTCTPYINAHHRRNMCVWHSLFEQHRLAPPDLMAELIELNALPSGF